MNTKLSKTIVQSKSDDSTPCEYQYSVQFNRTTGVAKLFLNSAQFRVGDDPWHPYKRLLRKMDSLRRETIQDMNETDWIAIDKQNIFNQINVPAKYGPDDLDQYRDDLDDAFGRSMENHFDRVNESTIADKF